MRFTMNFTMNCGYESNEITKSVSITFLGHERETQFSEAAISQKMAKSYTPIDRNLTFQNYICDKRGHGNTTQTDVYTVQLNTPNVPNKRK